MNNHIEKPPFLKRKQGHFAKGTRFKARPMATKFQLIARIKSSTEPNYSRQ